MTLIEIPGAPECVLLRHGDTADTDAGVITGWRDVPLTQSGRRRAAETARRLAPLGIRRIVSSDLARAAETARIIARELGLPAAEHDPRWRERNWGDREGRPRSPVARPGDDLVPPGGESRADVEHRVFEALADVRPRTLVVTHAGPIRRIIARAAGDVGTVGPCGAVVVNASIAADDAGEYRMVAHVATPGAFVGRVAYVRGAEDVAKVDEDTLAILCQCPKSAAIDAMDRAAATINLTRALTAHLTHGRIAPKPYAVAFEWPDGYPRKGERVKIVPEPPAERRDRELFPDVSPMAVEDAARIGGKAAGLDLLRSLGVNVPTFHVIPIPTIEKWSKSGRFVDAARDWVDAIGLERTARWAVRSSADVEDGDEQPMSGTFESRVDVARDDVPGAIVDVFASAAGPEVRARIAAGELAEPPRMAVVVQRMIGEPMLAGAVFVPAPDDPAEMLVEGRLSAGGEALMDGMAGPDVTARFDVAGSLVRLDSGPAVAIDEATLRPRLSQLAAKAAWIHAQTGRGDLEYAIDSEGTTWWLQARVLPAAVEIIDRRGYAPAAQAYYRALAFRVHDANLTPPAHFRCIDLADGRFGYTAGIRRRDGLFHEKVARSPEHLAEVSRFGWRVDAEFLDVVESLEGRDPDDVLDTLILHSAVQIPFSMPLAGVHMDRFQSEPVDGHGGPGMIERFLDEVRQLTGWADSVSGMLSLMRQPLRTFSMVESIRLRRDACAAGEGLGDTTTAMLMGLDLRDVPPAADVAPDRLRERVRVMIAADRQAGVGLADLDSRLASQLAAVRDAAERRGKMLAALRSALPPEQARHLDLWAEYLQMKAETNETHALHRGRCFIWFSRLGYRPDPRSRAGFRPS